MAISSDLTEEALSAAMPSRAIQTYEAVVSTGSAAHGWVGADAPHGAVVVAEHQLSPRGHAGRPLTVDPGQGLGFSLILRPEIPAEREGWLYSLLLVALSDVLGHAAAIRWPDELRDGEALVAAVGVTTAVSGGEVEWAIADVLMPRAEAPRVDVLRQVLDAVDVRLQAPGSAVVDDYDRRCTTIGERVRARLRAGTGPRLEGTATATLDDGALVLEIADGRTAPVRPQDVRALEPM